MDGAFIENVGPVRIDQNGKIQLNTNSFNEYANVLFSE